MRLFLFFHPEARLFYHNNKVQGHLSQTHVSHLHNIHRLGNPHVSSLPTRCLYGQFQPITLLFWGWGWGDGWSEAEIRLRLSSAKLLTGTGTELGNNSVEVMVIVECVNNKRLMLFFFYASMD